MMSNVMVDALVAAVNGVASAQHRDVHADSWKAVSRDVEAQVSDVLRALPSEEIATAGAALGLVAPDREAVERAVHAKVADLVTAVLAA